MSWSRSTPPETCDGGHLEITSRFLMLRDQAAHVLPMGARRVGREKIATERGRGAVRTRQVEGLDTEHGGLEVQGSRGELPRVAAQEVERAFTVFRGDGGARLIEQRH